MANMIPQTDGSRREAEGTQEDEDAVSAVARAAAGASAVTNQQLRKARERVDEQVSVQRDRVTARVRTLGRALKGAGEVLEEDDLVAQCLHFASDKVNSVAGYVEELSPDEVADDLRGVARERPAWFFGGAFVLGLALGRFARSTAGNLAAASSKQSAPRGRRTARSTSATARTSANQTRTTGGTPTRAGAARS